MTLKILKTGIRDAEFGADCVVADCVNIYDAIFGDRCFVGPWTEVQENVVIGDNVRIQSHTLICEGTTGEFLEIDTEGNLVWKYVNPITSGGPITQGDPATNNRVFRVERLAPDDPGLAGQDLTPGDPLELFTLPLPVPDGTGITTPLIASRTTVAGDELNVQWDVSTCSAVDHNLIYGSLQSVSSYTIDGAECAIGAAGDHDWFGVPPGDLYFVIVGVDQTAVYESSWGDDGTGSERNGTAASAQCGASNKVITLTCP